MPLSRPTLAIDIQLPNLPPTDDPEMRVQLQYLYNAAKLLQTALCELREEFDAYVATHP